VVKIKLIIYFFTLKLMNNRTWKTWCWKVNSS